VPLDANHPPVGVIAFHSFDHAVVGARAHAHGVTEAIHGLMVDGVHVERRAAEDPSEPRRRFDADAVNARRPLPVELVLRNVALLRRKILNERASESDVHDLNASADRERGQVSLARRGQQGELGDITRAIHSAERRVRCVAVERWIHVFTATQHESRNRIENANGSVRVGERGHDQRNEPRTLERPDVRGVQTHTVHAVDNTDRGGDGDQHSAGRGARRYRSSVHT